MGRDFKAHLVPWAGPPSTSPGCPKFNPTVGGQGSSRGDTRGQLWAGWKGSGEKAPKAEVENVNKPRVAPVGPVGGNSSSGGWVHPGGRPRVTWKQLQLCRGGFFPSLALGKCAERIICFFQNFVQKQKIASVPRSLRSCHLARWYHARHLSSPEPPATPAVSLSPPSSWPPSPAAGAGAGEMSAVPQRWLGGWFCRRANSRQS